MNNLSLRSSCLQARCTCLRDAIKHAWEEDGTKNDRAPHNPSVPEQTPPTQTTTTTTTNTKATSAAEVARGRESRHFASTPQCTQHMRGGGAQVLQLGTCGGGGGGGGMACAVDAALGAAWFAIAHTTAA